MCSAHRKLHCSCWRGWFKIFKMLTKQKSCVGWGNQTPNPLPRSRQSFHPPLCPLWIAAHWSLFETAATVVLQHPPAYSELRASLISCLIYPGPCAAATVKSISDVIPLLPQQCNSPALYCADGLSPIILFMAVGRFNRQREVWWGISNKGTMTS